MQVFKFGGASVNTVDRIKNVADIIAANRQQPLLIVISAIGKTTNALEKVVEAFFAGNQEQSLALFHQVKEQHLTTAKYLLVEQYLPCEEQLRDFFTEVEWLLHDRPVRSFDYYYDQVVAVGELLSTAIVSHFLLQSGIQNTWIDVRDIIRTDDNFRDANIDWDATAANVANAISKTGITLTQGFIGATAENESVTLGREGSDYTAAVFANLLDAEAVTIWKDVEGVMNADPKLFTDAVLMNELNYDEVIEMAYYGAQVIHPKTIKPLQNKSIPLHVKSFIDPSLAGTVIHSRQVHHLPPVIVIKKQQVLMHLHTQDFSFIGERPISELYQILADLRTKPNLIQTGAVSLVLCLDDRSDKIEQLAMATSAHFEVSIERGLEMLTVRHYTQDVVDGLLRGKEVVLKQQSPITLQAIIRSPQ